MYSTSGKKVWILLENFCVLTYEYANVHTYAQQFSTYFD